METKEIYQEKSKTELLQLLVDLQSELAVSQSELAVSQSELAVSQSELAALQSKFKASQSEIASLRVQLNQRLRHLFGKRSEKTHPDQLELDFTFDEATPPENIEAIETADESITILTHQRKKTGRKLLPKDLPRVEKIYDLPDEEKVCACGSPLTQMKEDVSEQLDFIPAKVQVIKHVRLKYACQSCKTGVKLAKLPKQPIPKSIASPGLLAHLAVSKYCDHLPFYRLEGIMQRMGVDIARNTTASWMIKVGELLRPLYECLIDTIRSYDITYADETNVQVLKEGNGRPAESKSYMWCFIGGPPDKRSIVYHYDHSRAHTVIEGILSLFKGTIHCDGYGAYETYAKKFDGVHLSGCWMHCRRKFYEVSQQSGKSGLADKAMRMIQKLYRIEKDCRAKGFTIEEVYLERQQRTKPILEQMKSWLDKQSQTVLPKSPLGMAMSYAINQWDKLTKYITDGRLEIDNGLTERKIKPFVIGRKNWLFFDSLAGVKSAQVIYSLLETAKEHGKEPYTYLRQVLTEIPSCETQEEIEALLPYQSIS